MNMHDINKYMNPQMLNSFTNDSMLLYCAKIFIEV